MWFITASTRSFHGASLRISAARLASTSRVTPLPPPPSAARRWPLAALLPLALPSRPPPPPPPPACGPGPLPADGEVGPLPPLFRLLESRSWKLSEPARMVGGRQKRGVEYRCKASNSPRVASCERIARTALKGTQSCSQPTRVLAHPAPRPTWEALRSPGAGGAARAAAAVGAAVACVCTHVAHGGYKHGRELEHRVRLAGWYPGCTRGPSCTARTRRHPAGAPARCQGTCTIPVAPLPSPHLAASCPPVQGPATGASPSSAAGQPARLEGKGVARDRGARWKDQDKPVLV